MTGSLLARRLASMMFATVAVALTAIVIGLYLSFHFNLPTGPAIVVVSVGLLLVTVAVSPKRWTLLARLRRQPLSRRARRSRLIRLAGS